MNDLFNNERKELQAKIDNVNSDLNNKEKELTTLVSKKEQLEKIVNDKDELIKENIIMIVINIKKLLLMKRTGLQIMHE